MKTARFGIGHVVKHRVYPFRGVIFDVDPVFANTEEWLMSIPEEVRPRRDQPWSIVQSGRAPGGGPPEKPSALMAAEWTRLRESSVLTRRSGDRFAEESCLEKARLSAALPEAGR